MSFGNVLTLPVLWLLMVGCGLAVKTVASFLPQQNITPKAAFTLPTAKAQATVAVRFSSWLMIQEIGFY